MKNNMTISERNALVTAHMHIVPTIARQFYIAPAFRDDLIQEGNIGLIVAAEHFDHSTGISFASYAAWWVRRYIGRAVLNFSQIVRLPQRGSVDPIYTEPLDRVVAYDDEEALTYEDLLTDVGTADQALLRQQQEDDFADRLARLSPRELEVITLHYGLTGEPVPTSELAERLQITPRMVQIIIQKSIEKMR